MNSIFKGKGIIVGYTAALLLAAGLAFALSALPPGAGRERQEAAAAAKYKEALALMDGGSMDEALGLLEELPYGYRDVYPLTAYIEALRLYEAGDDPYYYDVISRLSHISEEYPGEYSAEISALRRQARDNFGRAGQRQTFRPWRRRGAGRRTPCPHHLPRRASGRQAPHLPAAGRTTHTTRRTSRARRTFMRKTGTPSTT